jgi:hypothetical protein
MRMAAAVADLCCLGAHWSLDATDQLEWMDFLAVVHRATESALVALVVQYFDGYQDAAAALAIMD